MKTAELGAGERPGVEFVPGLNALERKYFKQGATESVMIDKGITRLNFALAGEEIAPGKGIREALQPLTHDVTTRSLGLFTDTARGGLRQDFQLLTNTTSLPAIYQNKGVYVSRLGMTAASAPSDPTWASLQQFSRLYRETPGNTAPFNIINPGGMPLIKAQAPSGWVAATGGTVTGANRVPPSGLLLQPTLAKVQVLFSLLGRDIYRNLPQGPIQRQLTPEEKAPGLHGMQDQQFRNTRFDYDLHLMYQPIVTLHNPYNVALEFTSVRVEFMHVPFAMQVFRNDLPQSTGFAPMETMFADNESGAQTKIFGMNLKNKKADGTPGTTTITLLPGEVKLFSGYIDPNRTFAQDVGDRQFWDHTVGTGITTNIDALPGWRGDGIGFDCDWLTGSMRINGNADEGHDRACLGLAWDDKI